MTCEGDALFISLDIVPSHQVAPALLHHQPHLIIFSKIAFDQIGVTGLEIHGLELVILQEIADYLIGMGVLQPQAVPVIPNPIPFQAVSAGVLQVHTLIAVSFYQIAQDGVIYSMAQDNTRIPTAMDQVIDYQIIIRLDQYTSAFPPAALALYRKSLDGYPLRQQDYGRPLVGLHLRLAPASIYPPEDERFVHHQALIVAAARNQYDLSWGSRIYRLLNSVA